MIKDRNVETAIRRDAIGDALAAPSLPREAEVVVVGGGCMGASIAFHLARRDVDVVLLEKDHVASGATGHSGALVRQHYESRIGIRLARESLASFQRFEKETGFPCDFRPTGFLSGTRARDVPAFDSLFNLLHSEGVRIERLSPSDAKIVEPQLEVSDYAAVVYDPAAGYADPIATAHGFAAGRGQGHPLRLPGHRPAENGAEPRAGGDPSLGDRPASTGAPREAVPADGRSAAARGMVGSVRRHAGFLPDPRPVRPRRPLRRGRLQRPRIQALARSGPAPGRIRRDGTSAGGAGGVASVPVRGRPAGPARRALPPTGPTTPIVRGIDRPA